MLDRPQAGRAQSHFADLPHLLVPVIVHPKRAAEALAWVVREMEQRYELLAMVGVRDIDGYRAGMEEGRCGSRRGRRIASPTCRTCWS